MSFFACKKDKYRKQVTVRYDIRIGQGNSVLIQCFNDYYFDNGKQLKTMRYKSNYDYWFSTHNAYVEEGYYLNIKPDTLLGDTINLQASVYVNDTLLEQKISITKFTDITLQGQLK